MKLNYKRTVLVGFAFFLIQAFWSIYDVSVAMSLNNKFGMSHDLSGAVLALDNVLALFMLPLFGSISDKCTSRFGRRTPFIAVGTVIAAVLLVGLSFVDNAQLANIEKYTKVNDPETMQVIYDEQSQTLLKTPEGESFRLVDLYTREEFSQLTTESETTKVNEFGLEVAVNLYTEHVVPAREACATAVTAQNPSTVWIYVGVLLLLLISMSTFRTPAVALMPDVTVKPLRSKANAVINLMGSAGAIIVLGVSTVLAISKVKNAYMSYTGVYVFVAVLMLGALAVFLFTVKEKKWAAQMEALSQKLIPDTQEESVSREKRAMTSGEKWSLAFLMISIVLWFFGYNAVTSKYPVYAQSVLNMDATLTLLLANLAAIVSYIPVGMLSSRLGRKKMILVGIALLFAVFLTAGFMRATSPSWLMYLLFCLAGVAWASISVNSFPMVVELCTGADVGKYTGYYYTASMAAQSLTPYFSGLFLENISMTTLFPYATVFVGLSFVSMCFVRHGDTKVQYKKGLEALDVDN